MLKPSSPRQQSFGKSSGLKGKKPIPGRLKQKAMRAASGLRASSGMR